MRRAILHTLFTFFISAFLIVPPVKSRLESIRSLTFEACDFPESSAFLNSPYEGYYHIYGYVLKDNVSYRSLEDVPHIKDMKKKPPMERLVQIQINLNQFSNRPISESALQQLDTILDAWSRTQYTIILRPVYDWDGRALKTEPGQLEQILSHMEQIAQVYNKYSDHIFMIHGLSTGNYGEMHHTRYGSRENLAALGSKLAEVSAPSIYLSVRTPNQWRDVTGADSYAELAAMPDNPYLGRLGLFNDGMLGSASDTGTYTDRSREEELAFQDELCRTVPNGGEVIINNRYNDLENAIRDMQTMHVSFLNSQYDPAVLNKWKKSVYSGGGVFDGVSGYEYIRRHLGYRYVIRQSRVDANRFGQNLRLLLSIENVGFSASYRRFSFELTLRNTETGEINTITPEQDSSCLPSGATTLLEIPLDHMLYPLGTYELYWQTTDDLTGEIILYGNDIPLTQYGYQLGSLTIEAPYRFTEEQPFSRPLVCKADHTLSFRTQAYEQ